jgi:methionyl-tRNA formyltransferase
MCEATPRAWNAALNCLHPGPAGAPKVLVLGYGPSETTLIAALASRAVEVWHTDARITDTAPFDLVVSFGYRHILRRPVIDSSPARIVNLHIAYLPFNRGAHPNFWSFFDGTPSGVTIHLIEDEGIDTGRILFQRYVNFAPDETTFAKTYRRLIQEIEALFIAHFEAILSGDYTPKTPRHAGTFHRASELPKDFAGWDQDIEAALAQIDAARRSSSAP